MRAVVDMAVLGERTLTVDCDVLQADGGTRTAAVTGAYVALYQALERMAAIGVVPAVPISSAIAATSVGVAHGQRLLDLCYDEDSTAEVDFNVVMTDRGEFVEVQGTAEGRPFNRETVDFLLTLAEKGIRELFQAQQEALKSTG
jgi:ribonuclease PH